MIAAAEWKPADGLTLEPNALRAAKEIERSLALTAGPGAGKSEMLAQRADFLLRTGSCRYPKRILAISFKVDASRNLKERVLRRCGPELASRLDSYTFHAFAKRIIDRFRPLLTGRDALDIGYTLGDRRLGRKQIGFEDLIPLSTQIFHASDEVLRAVRMTYSDVFLDEFQDCTGQQYDLVKLVFQGAGVRLTAVGDTKQKIMGWAGALDGIFATFAQDFDALPLNLYRNFRSKPRLLRLQNEVIRVMDPASVMPDEQVAGDEGEVLIAEFDTSEEEADTLAQGIQEWIAEGVKPSEIAVLIGKQPEAYAEQLMAAFVARGVPFRNEQKLQDLTAEPLARLIVDFLRCVYGQREPQAWLRLMQLLVPFADEQLQSAARQPIERFVAAKRREAAANDALGEPFANWWQKTVDFLKLVGVPTLVSLSAEYESKPRLTAVAKDVRKRISELMVSTGSLMFAVSRLYEDESVRILSIHKSKGLEYEVVVMMGVEEELFFGKDDEERSAFFVGISRAKRLLELTWCHHRTKPVFPVKRWDGDRNPQREFLGYVRA